MGVGNFHTREKPSRTVSLFRQRNAADSLIGISETPTVLSFVKVMSSSCHMFIFMFCRLIKV